MMAAEKAADLILGNTPLPPQMTEYYRHPLAEERRRARPGRVGLGRRRHRGRRGGPRRGAGRLRPRRHRRARTRAEALLAAHPEIEDDPWARLVLGRGWDGDAERAGRAARLGAARLRHALVLCHRPASRGSCSSAARTRTPSFVNEYGKHVCALRRRRACCTIPELTRLLLEAGADPDDGESLYHATEAEDPECLQLLLEHGAQHARDQRAGARARRRARCRTCGRCSRPAPIRTRAPARPRGPARARARVSCGCSRSTAPSSTGRAARPGAATCRCGRPTSTPCCAGARTRRGARRARGGDRGGPGGPRRWRPSRAASGRAPFPDEARPRRAGGPDPRRPPRPARRGGRRGRDGFRGVVGGSPEGTLLHHAAWVGDPDVVARCSRAGRTRWPAAPSGTPLGVGGPRLAVLGAAGPRLRRRRGAAGRGGRAGRAALPRVRGGPAVRVAREPARAGPLNPAGAAADDSRVASRSLMGNGNHLKGDGCSKALRFPNGDAGWPCTSSAWGC